jgi:hypothetical protein
VKPISDGYIIYLPEHAPHTLKRGLSVVCKTEIVFKVRKQTVLAVLVIIFAR